MNDVTQKFLGVRFYGCKEVERSLAKSEKSMKVQSLNNKFGQLVSTEFYSEQNVKNSAKSLSESTI